MNGEREWTWVAKGIEDGAELTGGWSTGSMEDSVDLGGSGQMACNSKQSRLQVGTGLASGRDCLGKWEKPVRWIWVTNDRPMWRIGDDVEAAITVVVDVGFLESI